MMIETLLQDGFPSTHPISKPIDNPYEIEEYYDLVETAKTASILRMVEGEFPVSQIFNAMTVCFFFFISFHSFTVYIAL